MEDAFKIIAFDVDGTLTKGNIWQRLHQVAGVSPEEDSKWFLEYYSKKITFSEWADFINKKYRESKKTRSDFEKVMRKVSLMPLANKVIRDLQKKYTLCLVSSGVDIYVGEVARRLAITEYSANYFFDYDKQKRIVSIQYIAPEDKAKVLFLKKICKEKKIQPENIVFIGDSSNDLEAFQFTKRGILVGPGNDKLRKASWKQVKKLTEIASILNQ